MRISGMEDNTGFRSQVSGLRSKSEKTKNLVLLLVFSLLICGCKQNADTDRARNYVRESENNYRQAVRVYNDAIAASKDNSKLYFELGKLYFDHGKFSEAAEAFKKSPNIPEANKFLALSYFSLGNFTDALEVFNKKDIPDDQYQYYYGLTCEKLNLFDQAMKIYSGIKSKEYAGLAAERLQIIERQAQKANIKELDPALYRLISQAPAQEQYPQAGALILACDEKIEVRKDDTELSDFRYAIKILNERGKEDYSEIQIDYDSTYEKVELVFARTIKPDGSVAEVGTRHLRDVSKYLNFPLYSNARVFIISFPEIAEGSTVEYRVKIHCNKLINKRDFIQVYPVQSSEPIIDANFTLSFPKDRQCRMKILNSAFNDFGAALEPQKEEGPDTLTYRWHFANIPEIIPESNMPPRVEVNPTILLSTFASWQDIWSWWHGLAKDKINPDKAIRDKVKELIRKASSEEEKARAIYNFCAQKIRYVAVEYGDAGYEPHQAADIFKNKYGDCKDQAILLVTMLREAGLIAWPVLIPTEDYYNALEDFPAMLFNHAIACVQLKDRIVFLDPTAQTCSFADLPSGDQERKVVICKPDGFHLEKTPLFGPEHNLVRQETKIQIDREEGIRAEKSIFTFGVFEQGQRYWLLYTQPELIQEQLKERIQDISIGAKLARYTIDNLDDLNKPVVLRYSFSGPEYSTQAGPLRILPQLASLDTSLVAKDQRRYDIDFGILDSRQTDYELVIPKGFSVRHLPADVFEDSPWLSFRVTYAKGKDSVLFKQESAYKKKRVTPQEYAEFKEFYEGLAKKLKQRIVLEKKD